MAKILCLVNNQNGALPPKAIDALSYNKNWQLHSYKTNSVYMAALDLPFKMKFSTFLLPANRLCSDSSSG